MNMKKILALLLVLVMLLSVVACTANSDGKNDVDNNGQNNGDNNGANNGDNNSENNSGNNGENNGGDGTSDGSTDSVEIVEVGEFLDLMASSVYKITDTVTEAKIGLTDSKNVGVDKERFENEILYPVPEDSSFAKIYKVTDHGISTENTGLVNSAKFKEFIAEVKEENGLKKIEFAPGVYKFDETIKFDGINDLYFCSSDPTKNFEILMTSWTQAISVEECDNVHFNNFDLDYETSPTVAGEIVAYDEKTLTVTLKIFDEFDLTRSAYGNKNLGQHASGWASYIEFVLDEASGEYIPDNTGNIRTGSEIASSSYDSTTKEMKIVFTKAARYPDRTPKIGERASIAFTMYNHHGFNGANCGKLYMESVNIYTTPGMAIGLSASEGFYLNRIKLDLREGSTRLMTATADGFHTSDIREIKITNSVFQYSHDDAFNIKNSYVEVTNVVSKKVYLNAPTTYVIEPGDELEFFEEATMVSHGRYKVVKVEGSGTNLTVQLDRKADESIKGCLAANNTKATKFTLDNSVIGNKRNRGILLQSRESTIINNTWKNMIHCAVVVFTERYSFKEGICPSNVTIANNKFIGNYEGDLSVSACGSLGPNGGGMGNGVIEGITISNNFFADTAVVPLGVSSCKDSTVSNNLFYNTSLDEGILYGMSISYSVDCTVSNNYFYSTVKTKMTPLEVYNTCDNIVKNVNKFEKID